MAPHSWHMTSIRTTTLNRALGNVDRHVKIMLSSPHLNIPRVSENVPRFVYLLRQALTDFQNSFTAVKLFGTKYMYHFPSNPKYAAALQYYLKRNVV